MSGADEYYKLPREKLWLRIRGDNPYSIGGRDTNNLEQIAFSLRSSLNILYNNKILSVIEVQLKNVQLRCFEAENAIDSLIGYVSTHLPENTNG